MHFYDDSYPISPAALLRPPDATPEQYAVVQTQLGLDRAVVVQPTTYGLDNRCQLAGMATLGGRARGVVVVDQSATRSRLSELNDVGVCGVRDLQVSRRATHRRALGNRSPHILTRLG